jgi:hypothetical protein
LLATSEDQNLAVDRRFNQRPRKKCCLDRGCDQADIETPNKPNKTNGQPEQKALRCLTLPMWCTTAQIGSAEHS